MKHSTGRPTAAQSRRMAAIKDGPCVCCHLKGKPSTFPDVHHLLSGNKRRGHDFTIGLCPWHHRGYYQGSGWMATFTAVYGPSLAHGSKPFHEAFGSDDELLAIQNAMLGLAA